MNKLIIKQIKEELMLICYNNFPFDVNEMGKINRFCDEVIENVEVE